MRTYAVVSAAVAPVALIGGWIWAAARQPPGYDPISQTISALAARDATERWIMTAGLALLGLCHLVTAGGLTDAGRWGRALLAIGGAATVVVACLPQPASGHVQAAGVGFVALTLWPLVSRVPGHVVRIAVVVLFTAVLIWFATQLGGGSALGLSERILAGAQALWPLVVTLMLLLARRRRTTTTTGR
ncbi:putative membrane protein [Nakamurella sp. UYEF19]|uniref:DUF998 domain-containing protein n=1 Tax=Nakamurella sp. UYEF19 TaxID=1756392 RepID=UPI003395CD0A